MGIINNVRKTIIRDQLTDPRFYAEMSKLLGDLIKQSRADAAAYEEFLRKAEVLAKRLPMSPLNLKTNTGASWQGWRWRLIVSCGKRRRQVGRATMRVRRRCSMRCSRC